MKTADKIITDFRDRNKENPSNHSMLWEGKPGTGKNYGIAWWTDFGLASDNIKVVEANASSPAHLEEILQYCFPNGFNENYQSMKILEELRNEIKEGDFDCDTTVEDVDAVVEKDTVDEKVKVLEFLIREESNKMVVAKLEKVLDHQNQVLDKISKISKNIEGSRDVPKTFKDAIRNIEGKTTAFNVRVLTPISFGMPYNTDIPEFFEPFAIPVDAFKKYEDVEQSLKIIFGDSNIQSYRNMYNNLVEVDDSSLADLKFGEVDKDRSYVKTVDYGFGEMEVYDPGQEGQSLAQFKSKIGSMFNSEGVVCSSDFEYQLREKLKSLLLDDSVDIIVLYTGFLRDEGLKKFVITYFLETYRSVIEDLDTDEVQNIDKKFVVKMLESQDIVRKPGQNRKLSVEDKVFARFMRQFMNNPRHFNTDVWVDSKPSDTHKIIREKVRHRLVTVIDGDRRKKLLSHLSKETRDDIKKAFSDEDYNRIGSNSYGFMYMNEDKIVSWQKRRNTTYGYRLPCPRLAMDVPVTVSNSDFSFFTEELGMNSFKFKDYIDELAEDWKEAEKRPISYEDKKLEEEKEKEEQERKKLAQMRKSTAKDKLKAIVSNRDGLPSSWSDVFEQIKEEMIEEDLVDDNFSIRNIQKYTKDLRDQLEQKQMKKQKVQQLDHKEVIEKLKRDEDFVFTAPSKDLMRSYALTLIESEYEVATEVAENFIDKYKVVEKGRAELMKDGVINKQNNNEVSKDEWRQMYDIEEGVDDEQSSLSDVEEEDVGDQEEVGGGLLDEENFPF